MQFVSWIVWLATLVVAILVLVKLFQKEGVVKGILGLICLLYTFIWGWMHAKEQNITNLMWAWTGLIVVSILVNALVAAQAAGNGSTWLLSLI